MGDHTDYNEGFVLPVAIDLECRVEAAARDDRRVVVRSAEFEGVAEFAADGSTDPRAVAPEWGRLAAAVVGVLASRGRPATGADLKVASNVPVGSGLSSSAAFEVAVATALCGLGGFPLDLVHLALACQEAEQRATGVPCGVMDQLTSAAGVADHALLLDCRSLRFVPVALPSDLVIVVVHSGMARRLTDTPYAERRAACKAAAARLGVPSLRDATVDQVADDPVARHVVTENARVGATAMALAAGDLAAIGQAFAASHTSLRDDFGCSTTETDQLVRGGPRHPRDSTRCDRRRR
ncbi:MAG: galactokinase [Actinobacteria bacterium]|nr:galactokinase [Actinomycetota bacterium]